MGPENVCSPNGSRDDEPVVVWLISATGFKLYHYPRNELVVRYAKMV